jgi:hypothetical protein
MATVFSLKHSVVQNSAPYLKPTALCPLALKRADIVYK